MTDPSMSGQRRPLQVASCGRRISTGNHIASSYQLLDSDPLVVASIDGPKKLGRGWYVVTAAELVPTVPFIMVEPCWYRMDDPAHPPPMDGSKVDLLYPHPRGRTINCFWEGSVWGWREPTWYTAGDPEFIDGVTRLKPESEWDFGNYPNLKPSHWIRPPGMPNN